MHRSSLLAGVFTTEKNTRIHEWLDTLPLAISYYFDALGEPSMAQFWNQYLGEGRVCFHCVKEQDTSISDSMAQFKKLLRFQSIEDDFIFDEALVNIMRFWSNSFVKITKNSKDYQRLIDSLKSRIESYQPLDIFNIPDCGFVKDH